MGSWVMKVKIKNLRMLMMREEHLWVYIWPPGGKHKARRYEALPAVFHDEAPLLKL